MNKILWDLINTRKVVSFIDDVIIGTEREEGHDKYYKTIKCGQTLVRYL